MSAKNGKARLVGVIGDPITQSLSPAIHEYWLQNYDINGAYIPLHINAAKFEPALGIYVESGFVGFNVTLPHKETTFRLMQSYDDICAVCKATNTIIVQKNGTLHGMNTDAYGFTKMLEEEQGTAPFSTENVLLMGAGGSARAVVFALAQLGCRTLTIINRTAERAEALIQHMQGYMPTMHISYVPLHEFAAIPPHIQCVVNTFSTGQSIVLNWDNLIHNHAEKCMYVDVSYSRYGTEMTRSAARFKRRNTDGLRMLLHQAVPGFEQWFGVTPKVDKGLIAHVRKVSESNQ